MNREIKFRGLESMTGKWAYGNLIIMGTGCGYIIPQNLISNEIPQWLVDRDTVGQFALKDKNGKEIYEGDIVYQEFYDGRSLDVGGFTGVVKMYEGCWWIDNGKDHAERLWSEVNLNEVLGNIYETPELLNNLVNT